MQARLAPAATVWLTGHDAVLGEPGRPAAFGNVQNALFAAAVPTLVQVTVHDTVAAVLAGFGTQATVLVMSAPVGWAFTGTVVLELLLPCCAAASLLAVVVAGIVSVPAAVGVKLTVQASVPPGATLPLGEHTGTGVPGSPLVLIEHVAAVAVTVPMFSQIAVQVTGAPTTPGVGEHETVLTMSGVFGAGGATIVTVSLPLLLPVAVAGSFVAPVVELTVTVPGAAAVKITLQPSDPPATTSTGAVAFGHTTVAPAGNNAALLT